MSHDAHDVKQSVRRYLFVFYALLMGTAITVGAWTFKIENVALTILIALFIACIKAFLVAGFFMHLISEKTAIYAILSFTAFFFAGLMALTIWAMNDFPSFTAVLKHVP